MVMCECFLTEDKRGFMSIGKLREVSVEFKTGGSCMRYLMKPQRDVNVISLYFKYMQISYLRGSFNQSHLRPIFFRPCETLVLA